MTDAKEGLRKLLCPDSEVDAAIRVLEKIAANDKRLGEKIAHRLTILELTGEEIAAAENMLRTGLVNKVTEDGGYSVAYGLTSKGAQAHEDYQPN